MYTLCWAFMKRKLTDRQAEILTFIGNYCTDHGYPPTVREIASFFGFKGVRAAHKHLTALSKKGFIRRRPGRPRAIEIVGPSVRPTAMVPVLGTIPAGPLDLAWEEREGEMEVDGLLRNRRDLFMLRVKGESMVGAHIADGDFALIQLQNTAENGDIVAVRIGEEATLKRFYREGDTIRLQPENPDVEAIVLSANDEDLAIMGKVRRIIRSLP